MMPWTWSMQPLAWDSKLDVEMLRGCCKGCCEVFLELCRIYHCDTLWVWYIYCMIHYDTLWYIMIHYDTLWLWYMMIMIHYDYDTLWYIMIHYDTLWYMIPYTLTFNIDELCRIGLGSALSIDKAEGPEDPERQVELGRFHAMAGWAGSPCWSLPSVTESRPWSLGGTSCRFLHVQALFRDLQFLKAFQHFMRPPRALQHLKKNALHFKASRLVSRNSRVSWQVLHSLQRWACTTFLAPLGLHSFHHWSLVKWSHLGADFLGWELSRSISSWWLKASRDEDRLGYAATPEM